MNIYERSELLLSDIEKSIYQFEQTLHFLASNI